MASHVHYEEVMRTKNGGQHARITQTYVGRQLIVFNLYYYVVSKQGEEKTYVFSFLFFMGKLFLIFPQKSPGGYHNHLARQAK